MVLTKSYFSVCSCLIIAYFQAVFEIATPVSNILVLDTTLPVIYL